LPIIKAGTVSLGGNGTLKWVKVGRSGWEGSNQGHWRVPRRKKELPRHEKKVSIHRREGRGDPTPALIRKAGKSQGGVEESAIIQREEMGDLQFLEGGREARCKDLGGLPILKKGPGANLGKAVLTSCRLRIRKVEERITAPMP